MMYAVKELCRGMSQPIVGDRRALKRSARYLVAVPRIVSRYESQCQLRDVKGFSDSDWPGCNKTFRSTSGGATMLGKHCVMTGAF